MRKRQTLFSCLNVLAEFLLFCFCIFFHTTKTIDVSVSSSLPLSHTLPAKKDLKNKYLSKQTQFRENIKLYFYASTFWRNLFCFHFSTQHNKNYCRFRFQFAAPLPHTSRQKRPEEDSGIRYWFCDREDMEYSIKQHEFLEYGEFNGNLYGL